MMKLPKELTTVTPLSKSLAIILFIALPFLGFYLGHKYEQQFTQYLEDRASLDQYAVNPSPASAQDPSTANWKTYINEELGFEVKYPSFLKSFVDTPEYPIQSFSGYPLVLYAGTRGGPFQIIQSGETAIFFRFTTTDSIENEIENFREFVKTGRGSYREAEIVIDGYRAIEFVSQGIMPQFRTILVSLPSEKVLEILSEYYLEDLEQTRYDELFDQILSTFQFLP